MGVFDHTDFVNITFGFSTLFTYGPQASFALMLVIHEKDAEGFIADFACFTDSALVRGVKFFKHPAVHRRLINKLYAYL